MDFPTYLKLISRKKQVIMSVVIVFLIISVLASFLQPFKYSSEAKLLVVQNFTPGLDPYNMTKSNEYLANVLSQVVNTNSFFVEVMNAGFNIKTGYFPEDSQKQLKAWNKTVKADTVSNAGIITLAVYHRDKMQSDQIMRAIIQVLKSKHTEYHGSGDQVEIRVIDQPTTSTLPVKPNFAMNLFLGFVIGLLSALSYIYLYSAPVYGNGNLPSRPRPEETVTPVEHYILAKEHEYNERLSQARHNDHRPNRYEDDLEIRPQGNMQNIFGHSHLNG